MLVWVSVSVSVCSLAVLNVSDENTRIFVLPALAFRCISLYFVLARRLSTHRTEFASGPQLRNRNCSSHCILASCFLGPFLSVSVLFWHAQRQSRLQFSACFNESSRASRAAASYSAFLSRRQANCAYSFKYSVIVAPKRKHQLQPFGIFSSYRTQPAIGLQL